MKSIIVVVAISIASSLVQSAYVAKSKACCLGRNLYTNKCVEGENSEIHCSNGRYMLDPMRNRVDRYFITEQGYLEMESSEDASPSSKFCTTNFQPIGTNESREIALVCFDQSYDTVMALFFLKGFLALVSVVFILATLYVYWLIPDLRETQDKVTCIALSCLMTFLFFLALIQNIPPDKLGVFCAYFSYLVYFFTIAYFTWLNIVMVNVWKSTVLLRWQIKERTWYILNHIYGWSIPNALSIAVYLRFGARLSENSCWFQKKVDTWTFLYIPISIMLCINIILFFWSAWGLHTTGSDVSPDRRKALTYKFGLYLKLFMLAGLTWIFEVLSYQFGGSTYNGVSYWLIADVINGLHGLLIFFVLVVWRRKIRRELAGKRILCFRAPASWAEVENPEEEQLNDDVPTKHDLIEAQMVKTKVTK